MRSALKKLASCLLVLLMFSSTWNTGLLGEIGAATADEAKYYGRNVP